MFVQLCRVIRFLHQRNIIHRDIKLENILLEGKTTPKICDFGWSRVLRDNEQRQTFCGTFEYMAPEIFENEEYGKQVDIWSLGVILYELFHHKSPFAAQNTFKIYKKILNLEISLNRNVPLQVSQLILTLLQNDPKKRPTIDEVMRN